MATRERVLNLTFQARVEGTENFKKAQEQVQEISKELDDLNKKKLSDLLGKGEFSSLKRALEGLFGLINSGKIEANNLTTSMTKFVNVSKGLKDILTNETKSVEDQKNAIKQYVTTIDDLQKKLDNVKKMSPNQQKAYATKMDDIFSKEGLEAAEQYEKEVLKIYNEWQKISEKNNKVLDNTTKGTSVRDKLKNYANQLNDGFKDIEEVYRKITKNKDFNDETISTKIQNILGIGGITKKEQETLDKINRVYKSDDLMRHLIDMQKVFNVYSKLESKYNSSVNKPTAKTQSQAVEYAVGMNNALNTFKEQWEKLQSFGFDRDFNTNLIQSITKDSNQNFEPYFKNAIEKYNIAKDQFLNTITKGSYDTQLKLEEELGKLVDVETFMAKSVQQPQVQPQVENQAKAQAKSIEQVGNAAEQAAERIKELEKTIEEYEKSTLSNGKTNPLKDLTNLEGTEDNITKVKQLIDAYKEYLSLAKNSGLKEVYANYKEEFDLWIKDLQETPLNKTFDVKAYADGISKSFSEVNLSLNPESISSFVENIQNTIKSGVTEVKIPIILDEQSVENIKNRFTLISQQIDIIKNKAKINFDFTVNNANPETLLNMIEQLNKIQELGSSNISVKINIDEASVEGIKSKFSEISQMIDDLKAKADIKFNLSSTITADEVTNIKAVTQQLFKLDKLNGSGINVPINIELNDNSVNLLDNLTNWITNIDKGRDIPLTVSIANNSVNLLEGLTNQITNADKGRNIPLNISLSGNSVNLLEGLTNWITNADKGRVVSLSVGIDDKSLAFIDKVLEYVQNVDKSKELSLKIKIDGNTIKSLDSLISKVTNLVKNKTVPIKIQINQTSLKALNALISKIKSLITQKNIPIKINIEQRSQNSINKLKTKLNDLVKQKTVPIKVTMDNESLYLFRDVERFLDKFNKNNSYTINIKGVTKENLDKLANSGIDLTKEREQYNKLLSQYYTKYATPEIKKELSDTGLVNAIALLDQIEDKEYHLKQLTKEEGVEWRDINNILEIRSAYESELAQKRKEYQEQLEKEKQLEKEQNQQKTQDSALKGKDKLFKDYEKALRGYEILRKDSEEKMLQNDIPSNKMSLQQEQERIAIEDLNSAYIKLIDTLTTLGDTTGVEELTKRHQQNLWDIELRTTSHTQKMADKSEIARQAKEEKQTEQAETESIKNKNEQIIKTVREATSALVDFNKEFNTSIKNNTFVESGFVDKQDKLRDKINEARKAIDEFNSSNALKSENTLIDKFLSNTESFDDKLLNRIKTSVQNKISKVNEDNLSNLGVETFEKVKNTFKTIDTASLEQARTILRDIISDLDTLNNKSNQKGDLQFLDSQFRRFEEWANANPKFKAYYGNQVNELREQFNALTSSVNPSQEAIENFTKRLTELRIEANQAGRVGSTFFDTQRQRMGSLTAYLATFASFYRLVGYGKRAFETVHNLDTALVDLQKTAKMTSGEFEEFYFNANNVAKQFGVTTKDIIDQASAQSRLGYNTKEAATTMAQVSSQFAAISPEMNVDEATTGLVSIMKAFDIEAEDAKEEIASKINAIGNAYATSNVQIVEGLSKSSAAMAAARNSFDETVALFTAGQEILQNAETMGQSLKTISMRIRGKLSLLPPYGVNRMLCLINIDDNYIS